MSLVEVLLVLACGGGLLAILALGAWVLINKSKLEETPRVQSRLEALDQEYAGGDLDEDEYQQRRREIQNDRMR
jgi:uncharacterized membrane protein